MERLYHPDTIVTADEIQKATEYMERHGMAISELSLSRILGVRQVFRRRTMKLGDLM